MRQRIRSMRGLVLVVCLLVAAVGLSAQQPQAKPSPAPARPILTIRGLMVMGSTK